MDLVRSHCVVEFVGRGKLGSIVVVFFAVVGRFVTEFVTVRVVKGKEQSESKTRLVATVSRWLTFLRTRAFN